MEANSANGAAGQNYETGGGCDGGNRITVRGDGCANLGGCNDMGRLLRAQRHRDSRTAKAVGSDLRF